MMDNNTHTYDGQIKDRYLSLKILDNKYLVNNITYEQALLEIYNSTSDNTVHQIIQKIQNSNYDNYDHTNTIHLVDLLPRVWKFYRLLNDKTALYEQIIDMKTGLCAQGRTIRLFQLYQCWIDVMNDVISGNTTDKENITIINKLLINPIKQNNVYLLS